MPMLAILPTRLKLLSAVVYAPHDTAVLYGLASAYDFADEEAQTFSRLIEHDAIHALVLTGLGDANAIATWQTILASPDTKLVGKGSWGDWFFILQQLAKSPYPPPKIEEVIELLSQYPQRM